MSVSFMEKLLDGAVVEFKRLGDIARIKNGKDHKALGEGEFPVYGSGGIMRYADTYAYNKPSVLIPRKGSLANLFFVDVPFWNVDTIFYTEIDEAQIRPKFLYYFLTTVGLGEMNQAGGVPSQTQSVLNELKIPIPCPDNPKKSLEIQAEIVRILDAFTKLTAELTAELNTRKKQYNHYRDQLLSFEFPSSGGVPEGRGGREVEWKSLPEMALDFGRGKSKHRPRNDEKLYGGDIPFIQTGDIRSASHIIERYSQTYSEFGLKQSKLWPKGTLCITIAANIAETSILGFDACFPDSVIGFVADPQKTSSDYVEYLLQSVKNKLEEKGKEKSSAQSNINLATFEQLKLPFPSLAEQARIVAILDKFDALTNSITEGLPREIELRQKQYAYYRDLLLSFPNSPPPEGCPKGGVVS